MKKHSLAPFAVCLALMASLFRAPAVGSENAVREGEMAGYLIVPHGRVAETYNAGFSMYVAAWPLLRDYPGRRFQTGLFGTWMHPQYDGPEPPKLYTDIEGGLGWWRDTRFATETPKFIMGGVALNFSAWANGPGAGKGRDWNKPLGHYGIAQLSPWLLWPPDGLNLKQGTCGQLFGYGYLPLPLTRPRTTTAGKNVPTGNHCWTLFLNTGNFKGPVAFFTPYFWSRASVDNPRLSGLFLDSRPSRPNRAVQMETQYVPASLSADAQGQVYARVAPTSFPRSPNGDSVVVHRITSYNKSALWDAVQAWFDGGAPAVGTVDPRGASVHPFKSGQGYSTWQIYAPGTASQRGDCSTTLPATTLAVGPFAAARASRQRATKSIEASRALFALSDPKHPEHRRAVAGLFGYDSSRLTTHPFCLAILGDELAHQELTGTTVTVDNDQVVWSYFWNGGGFCPIPDNLKDPKVRKEAAKERRCDRAALLLSSLVVGFPDFHPLSRDADQHIATMKAMYERYRGTFRCLSAEERAAFLSACDSATFRPDLSPLGRPATAADVKAGRAIFHLDGKSKVADLRLSAQAIFKKSAKKEESARRGLIVQAEVRPDAEVIYGIIERHAIRMVPARAIVSITPLKDLRGNSTCR